MAFLYDNISAIVVTTTVVLILASLQLRAMRLNTAATSRESALTQSEQIATWLEEDLEAMGRHMAPEDTVFGGLNSVAEDASPTDSVLTDLSFVYRDSPSGALQTVEYDVSTAGTEMVAGQERTLYELSRTKNGASAGRTPGMLGYFEVEFLDRTAAAVHKPVANKEQIEAVRVHFSVVLPFRNDKTQLEEDHRMVAFPYTPAHN